MHFEAPPREGLEHEVDQFLSWFASSRHDPELDPLVRAGLAHFWFVTLHPFEDGNGRIAGLSPIAPWRRRISRVSACMPCRLPSWSAALTIIGAWKRTSVARLT